MVRKYMTKHKLLYLVTVFLSSISAVGAVGIAYLLQRIIDLATEKELEQFKNIVFISVLYFVLLGIFNYMYKVSISYISLKINSDIRKSIFNSVVSKNYEIIANENTGEYISLITNDIKLVDDNYIKAVFSITENVIIFSLTLLGFLIISPLVTLFLMIGVVVLGIIPNVIGKLLEKKQEILSRSYSDFTQDVKGTFDGLEIIKAFGREKFFTKLITNSNEELSENKYRVDRVEALGGSVSFVFGFLLMVIVIIVSAYQVLLGVFSLGTLVALVQLSNTFVNPIINIMGYIAKIKSSKKIVDKLSHEVSELESPVYEHSFRNSLCLDDVGYCINGKKILEHINLCVEQGRRYLVIGESGAGKSTLLKLMSGLVREYSGKIYIDKHEVSKEKLQKYNYDFAYVSQTPYIFDMSIEENIVLDDCFDIENLQSVIHTCKLDELIEKRKNEKVGEGGKILSGGERQRVAIARALYHNKPVLFLDEITSALDNQISAEIEDSLLAIPNITIVAVSHDIRLNKVKKYDEIICIKEKKAIVYKEVKGFLESNLEFVNATNKEEIC